MIHSHLRTRHPHDSNVYMRTVEQVCEQRGLKLTPIRANALQLVAAARRPIKAYDLLGQLNASRAAAAPTTVYRALDFLLEHRFVHKLASINAYVRCDHPGERQHAVFFLICDCCQSVSELEGEEIANLLQASALVKGFISQAQTLEVHGQCSGCAKVGGS
jgi:Fur family transcriptional regulator, zinc uptake regulator